MMHDDNGLERDGSRLLDREIGISSSLRSIINSCSNVDDFRNILQSQGIWLNRKAAESAFYSFRENQSEMLDDSDLGTVTGGVTISLNNGALLSDLLHFL